MEARATGRQLHLGDGFVRADGRLTSVCPRAHDTGSAVARDYTTCLRSHHIVGVYTRGLHADRIVPLQLIEAGVRLALAGALAALCLSRARRIPA